MTRSSDLIETMAIAGAVACLVHCLAVPLGIAVLPAVTSMMPVPVSFHIAALLFAVPTTLLALRVGQRAHGRALPLVIGAIGLALLAIGVLVYGETPAEVPVTICGSLAIAAAHVTNWRMRRLRTATH